MIARLLMFAICLFAAWLIWRAVRGWIDASNAQRTRNDETLRLGHRDSESTEARMRSGMADPIGRAVDGAEARPHDGGESDADGDRRGTRE